MYTVGAVDTEPALVAVLVVSVSVVYVSASVVERLYVVKVSVTFAVIVSKMICDGPEISVVRLILVNDVVVNATKLTCHCWNSTAQISVPLA